MPLVLEINPRNKRGMLDKYEKRDKSKEPNQTKPNQNKIEVKCKWTREILGLLVCVERRRWSDDEGEEEEVVVV